MLKKQFKAGTKLAFNPDNIRVSLYRPFTYQYLYFAQALIHSWYQMPRIFPTSNSDNLAIVVHGRGAKVPFSALMVNDIVDLNFSVAGAILFPLYVYDKLPKDMVSNGKMHKQSAITEYALQLFQNAYKQEKITEEDIFYYIYALLYHPDYHKKYQDNLHRDLPRIAPITHYADYVRLVHIGKNLGDGHVNFTKVPMYDQCIIHYKDNIIQTLTEIPESDFYVEQMKFINKDKSKIQYNQTIRIENIPPQAHDYMVNNKSALAWVMDRQSIQQNKDTGIINDANTWAIETLNNPRYPLELLLRIITLSIKTQQIVEDLATIKISI